MKHKAEWNNETLEIHIQMSFGEFAMLTLCFAIFIAFIVIEIF